MTAFAVKTAYDLLTNDQQGALRMLFEQGEASGEENLQNLRKIFEEGDFALLCALLKGATRLHIDLNFGFTKFALIMAIEAIPPRAYKKFQH